MKLPNPPPSTTILDVERDMRDFDEQDCLTDCIKKVLPQEREVVVAKTETITKENLYEYAMQWRWKGEADWDMVGHIHQTLYKARMDVERIKKAYNQAETRIVRRPIVEWEVVE